MDDKGSPASQRFHPEYRLERDPWRPVTLSSEEKDEDETVEFLSRFGLSALSAGLLVALLGITLGPAQPARRHSSKTARARRSSSDSTTTNRITP